MKKGKISESVLKRSVLKYIRSKSEEVTTGAGSDCAFLKCTCASTCVSTYGKENGNSYSGCALAASTQTVSLPIQDAGSLAVYAAANNLAAEGARAFAAMLAITLPEEDTFYGEEWLRGLMCQIDRTCGRLGMEIAGGHTEATERVTAPVITVTALGRSLNAEGPMAGELFARTEKKAAEHKFDIVMTKWIGLEGTLILAREKRNELLTRYPGSIIESAQGFEKYLPVLPEAATALKSDVYAMHDARCGGAFGALWELGGRMGVGLSVDLKKIPVKQETIEICEFFDLNPYEILSGGSLLLAVKDGERLVKHLEEQGISAAVIGAGAPGNDRIVINGGEKRFLEPAKPDEILKVIY